MELAGAEAQKRTPHSLAPSIRNSRADGERNSRIEGKEGEHSKYREQGTVLEDEESLSGKLACSHSRRERTGWMREGSMEESGWMDG